MLDHELSEEIQIETYRTRWQTQVLKGGPLTVRFL